MCIAILVPTGFADSLDKDVLKNCRYHHPHGMGFAYVDDKGAVKVETFMGFKKFWKHLRRARENFKDTPFIVHFRRTSKGETDIANCHPFSINNEQAFMHNGTIWRLPDDPRKIKSDTLIFKETVLEGLPVGWDKNSSIKKLIETFITEKSKLVTLNSDKTYTIFNEKEGVWDKGIWWSNTTYREKFVHVGYAAANRSAYTPAVYQGDGSGIQSSREYLDQKTGKWMTEYVYRNGEVKVFERKFGHSSVLADSDDIDDDYRKGAGLGNKMDDYIECEFCGSCVDVGEEKILDWQTAHKVCCVCYEELSDNITPDLRSLN